MDSVFDWLVFGIAFFFAGSWTFGLSIRPDMRLKSTVVTVILWWPLIASAFLELFPSFALLWLMPLALLIPAFLGMSAVRIGGTSTSAIFILSTLVLIVPYSLTVWLL